MKRHILIAWCVVILFPLVCKCQGVQFMPVHFPEKYQCSTIFGMTQDLNGCTWLADRRYGLFKYDGVNFTHYIHNPYNGNSVNSGKLECTAADKRGNIWIGTLDRGLDRLAPETETFSHFTHNARDISSICCDSVRVLLMDREGTLWVGTTNGLDTLDSKTGKLIHITGKTATGAPLKHEHINALYQDREGTIWIGCGGTFRDEGPLPGPGGLYKYNKKTGSVTHYIHKNNDAGSLTDNSVTAIFEDSRGELWIGTASDGLDIMAGKSGTFIRHLYNDGNAEKRSGPPVKNTSVAVADHITFINEDVQGYVWIGTFENGLNRYNPITGTSVHFGKEEKGASKTTTDNYWTCFKTKENLLWMSDYEPADVKQLLYKVTPLYPQFTYSYLGKQPSSFANDPDSSIWIGVPGGGIVHVKNNSVSGTFLADANHTAPGNKVLFLENDGAAGLWVSTFENGLYLFDTRTRAFKGYRHDDAKPNSLASDAVFATQLDGKGKIWIGTTAGLDLLDIKTGIFTHYNSNPKDSTTLCNDFITCIKKDKGANIWAGTIDGLNRLNVNSKKWEQYLKGNNIFCIAADSHNRIWVSTQNSGLYIYNAKTDKFIHYNDITGLIKDDMPIFSLMEDREHSLWLSTQSGFIKLNPGTKTARWYGKSWGIGSLTSTGFISSQGEIFAGESAGYYHFFPASLNGLLSANQPPFISKFYLGNNPVKPGGVPFLPLPLSQTKQINLKYNQNNFALEFNYADFVTNPEDISMEYKLENYNDGWRKSGEEKKAYYYSVPPGKYIFKVKALGMFGSWAEKSITLIITPPWWQTWWAYILYIAFAAGSVLGFIYLRSKRLIKENRLLEQKIKLRTSEVLEQKTELTIQRDNLEKTLGELKSAQNQLIQSEKMASLGELTSGIAHEIQNPLNFVNNFSEVSIEMLTEMTTGLNKGDTEEALAIAEDLKQNLEKINQHGKRADSIVKGMLQHSRTNTGTKEITDINKLADEFMRLSYHGLRSKDKSFSVEMTTHFDEKLPKIKVIPQDMGRVLLNLFNNAFYAVNQKAKTEGTGYKPEVSVSTSSENGQVIIKVKDNGMGIPDAIKEKIMQPFFTTKPTGEGTGLGLSLTYDMVVKGHGGKMEVNTKEGEFTEFMVTLPLNEN